MRQSNIQHVENEVRGLFVAKAFRLQGRRLQFEFAHPDAQALTSAPRPRDSYTLIVQSTTWQIRQHGRSLATDTAWPRLIDQTLARCIDAQVRRVSFNPVETRIQFDKALVFELGAGDSDLGDPSQLVSWVLLRNHTPILSLGVRHRAAS